LTVFKPFVSIIENFTGLNTDVRKQIIPVDGSAFRDQRSGPLFPFDKDKPI
jgi:hypothetical protein